MVSFRETELRRMFEYLQVLVIWKITARPGKENPSVGVTALNIKEKMAKLKEVNPTMPLFDDKTRQKEEAKM